MMVGGGALMILGGVLAIIAGVTGGDPLRDILPPMIVTILGLGMVGMDRVTADGMNRTPRNALRTLNRPDRNRFDRLCVQHPILDEVIPRDWWPNEGVTRVHQDARARYIAMTLQAVEDDLPSWEAAADHVVDLLNYDTDTVTTKEDRAADQLRATYQADDPDPDIAELIRIADRRHATQDQHKAELTRKTLVLTDQLRRERDALEAVRLRALSDEKEQS